HTTNAMAGLLFIAIGVLFLRYDGTAGLTGSLGFGDTTDLEATAQQMVTEAAAAVPVWLVPALVAAVATGIAWFRLRHREGSDPTDTSELDQHGTRTDR